MKQQTSTKLALKRVLSHIPTPNWEARYPDLNRLEKAKVNALCQVLLEQTGHMVFGGPFSTMRLAESLSLAWDPRMILGSYEQEIHDIINGVICEAPRHIIDIGSAFGYYAVGFATKIKDTEVIAYEMDEYPHWAEAAELAELNDVSCKVIQRGICTVESLSNDCRPDSFILCDCEGAEIDLLNPDDIPALRTCKMLVEIHEFNRPGIIPALVSRFRNSHHLRIIEEGPRDPSLYRVLNHLPLPWRSVAVSEAKWIPGETSSRVTTWLRFMLLEPKH